MGLFWMIFLEIGARLGDTVFYGFAVPDHILCRVRVKWQFFFDHY
jgi:hypothetical protein